MIQVMQMIFHYASVLLSFPNVRAEYGVLVSRYDTAFIMHEPSGWTLKLICASLTCPNIKFPSTI
jgi:hypothetical protein